MTDLLKHLDALLEDRFTDIRLGPGGRDGNWFTDNPEIEKFTKTPSVIYVDYHAYQNEEHRKRRSTVGVAWTQIDGGFQLDGPGQFIQYLKTTDVENVVRPLILCLKKAIEQRNHYSDARCDISDFKKWDAELLTILKGEYEDAVDLKSAIEAEKDVEKNGTVTLEQVKKELGEK